MKSPLRNILILKGLERHYLFSAGSQEKPLNNLLWHNPMIRISQLKNVLSSTKSTNTSEDFFQSHRYIEAYVKRVFLIGLRLQGVQYSNATVIVEGTYIRFGDLIEKVLFLLDQSQSNQQKVVNDLKKAYPAFFKLNGLASKFTSPYRNRLAHGTIERWSRERSQ